MKPNQLVLPLISAIFLAQAPAWAEPIDAKIFAERNSFVKLAGNVTPSVVNIDVKTRETRKVSAIPEELRKFFGDSDGDQDRELERITEGKGSGVIIASEGLVLTNNHVVEGAVDIEVTLHDGRQYPARVVGLDPSTDLAVVKVDAPGPLPAAKIGSSGDLPIGSWLMAVGNPFGLEETVTVGILSGKGRVIGAGLYDDFLQTDAAINPGNSGGGLFNSEGELVGINTAVAGQGIGFAIPIDLAQRVATDLQAHGKVMRGYLGVAIQDVTPSLRQALKLPADAKGALLGQILADGPAGKSGLQPGDVVVEFDGKPAISQKSLLDLVSRAKVGSTVPLKVWRKGQLLSLNTKVGERPTEVAEVKAAPEPKIASKVEPSGFRATDMTPELARKLEVPSTSGVLIQEVREGSAAYRAGLRAGDVITEAGGAPVKTVADLDKILAASDSAVALLVARGDRQVFMALESST